MDEIEKLIESALGVEEPEKEEKVEEPKRKTTQDILEELHPHRHDHIRQLRPLWQDSRGQHFRVNFHYGPNNFIVTSAFVVILKGEVVRNEVSNYGEDPWEAKKKNLFRV